MTNSLGKFLNKRPNHKNQGKSKTDISWIHIFNLPKFDKTFNPMCTKGNKSQNHVQLVIGMLYFFSGEPYKMHLDTGVQCLHWSSAKPVHRTLTSRSVSLPETTAMVTLLTIEVMDTAGIQNTIL